MHQHHLLSVCWVVSDSSFHEGYLYGLDDVVLLGFYGLTITLVVDERL